MDVLMFGATGETVAVIEYLPGHQVRVIDCSGNVGIYLYYSITLSAEADIICTPCRILWLRNQGSDL